MGEVALVAVRSSRLQRNGFWWMFAAKKEGERGGLKAESVLTSLSRRGRTEGRVRSYFVVAAGGGLKAESVLSSLSRRGGLKAESVLLRCRGINATSARVRAGEADQQ